MHYTHGTGSHGGLRNFKKAAKPLTNEKIHGSAIILAAAMSNARDKTKVTWVSTLGGSAVLTQAMEILAKQNVKLDKHNIYLMEPTTSPTKALQAAYKLGIQPDRDAVKTGVLNYMANREQIGLVYKRAKNEKNYTLGNAAFDLVATSGSVAGLGTAGATLAGAVGLGVTMPAVPMMLTIGSVLGVAAAAFAVGETVTAAAAPHFYHKNIGKIK